MITGPAQAVVRATRDPFELVQATGVAAPEIDSAAIQRKAPLGVGRECCELAD
ncbi:MAG: hypothetical protein ACSLFR_01985 [Solirubrobacteraceae bacterium]